MLDAWAQTPAGRNLLAHALTQLARDGWLRPEPGDAWDPVPDLQPADPEPAPAGTTDQEPRRINCPQSCEIPAAVPTIARALAELPATCPQHGSTCMERRFLPCPTGMQARYRQQAELALLVLTTGPADPDTTADTPPDRSAEIVRGDVVGEPAPDRGPLPTRPDTVRTPPDADTPDTGVRVEYRARVPRGMLPTAVAEAFGIIARERGLDG
jgi:hypothetical protein